MVKAVIWWASVCLVVKSLGQALRAASHTTDRPAHSLHAYFLFGGDVNAPIIYEVDRIRDGRSFVSRQVRAIQHGKTIFMCMVSFAEQEEGLNYQVAEPEYPAVEDVKSEAELKNMLVEFVPENVRASFMRDRHVEIRPNRSAKSLPATTCCAILCTLHSHT